MLKTNLKSKPQNKLFFDILWKSAENNTLSLVLRPNNLFHEEDLSQFMHFTICFVAFWTANDIKTAAFKLVEKTEQCFSYLGNNKSQDWRDQCAWFL